MKPKNPLSVQIKKKEFDHNRYFRAIFECEKDTFKARLIIHPNYPLVAPVFKLSMKSHKNKHSIPNQIKAECDPDAYALATKTSHRNNEDINLRHIQTELNLNYKSILPSDRELDKLLSYQMRRLKICLDILSDTYKKGQDSACAKILGRPYRGKDRRIVLL